MDKIVVSTKFNKTGVRVLTPPLDERKVYEPARRLYRKAHHAAEAEWRRKWDSAIRAYVESMAHWVASYIARDSTPVPDKYRIAKFLAGKSLAAEGPMNINGPGSSRRWSNQLDGIAKLSGIEEEAWEAFREAVHRADAEKDVALEKARERNDDVRRALRREITQHVHQQFHPEDTH
jgi:hypothetical protein